MTDEEAAICAEHNLTSVGWERGIHVGTKAEQRALFPAALYTRMDMDPAFTDKSHGIMHYDPAANGTMDLTSVPLILIHLLTWLFQGLLLLVFLGAGLPKLFKPKSFIVEKATRLTL